MLRLPRNVVVAVLLFGVFYALFARFALRAFPFSGDEYSYFLQAELFARGMLRSPAPAHAELLRVDHVVIDDWVRSKYPPGASALLALGVRWGVGWLVTPVEGAVGLFAMACAARRLLPARETLIAVALLGAAPLFAFQAASFFSHTATTMWLAIAYASVVAWTCDPRSWRMLLAGCAIGCAFVTRPLDAVLFAGALVSLRSIRALGWAAAGASPFGAGLLAYHAAQFGSPFTDGYRAYAPTFRAIYGADTAAPAVSLSHVVNGIQFWNHLDILRSLCVDWTVPGTALFALLGWVALREDARSRPARRFGATLIGLFVISLLVTIGDIDDGARPRYLSTALLPIAWLGAPGCRSAARILAQQVSPVACRVVTVAVWIAAPLQLSSFLVWRMPDILLREGLEHSVQERGLRDAVVVIRALYPTRYARNGPFFDRPVLFVSAPATTSFDEVASAFPGRQVYEAREGKEWQLSRVR